MSFNLDEIKAREAAATQGPWRMANNPKWDKVVFAENKFVAEGATAADAIFIAHAREDIPALIAEVERLTEANKALDGDNYNANMNLEHVTAELATVKAERDAAVEENKLVYAAILSYGPEVVHDVTSRVIKWRGAERSE